GSGSSVTNATTMMINTIVISKIFYFFSIRTDQYGLGQIKSVSGKAWGVIALLIAFQLIFTYVPFMQEAFHVAGISPLEWLAVIIISALIMLCTEFDKLIRFQRQRTTKAN
ncbi:MAG: cation transporting ATPase C-terminal domain-containing protein, partial [Limosilactobacillus sp.]